MCDPISLTIAATAVATAGQAFSGYTAYQEARAKSAIADQNAALSREQAADSIERGEREQQRQWRQVAQVESAQIAAMAASGIDTGFGSARDLITDTRVLGTEDVATIAENYARETRGFSIQAQNFNRESNAQSRAATNGLISTGFQIGGTILGGAQQLQGMKLPTAGGSMGGADKNVGGQYIRTS